MIYYVYAVASISNKYVYIGQTNNLDRRINEHNKRKTKSNRLMAPFKLILCERYKTRMNAVEREKEL